MTILPDSEDAAARASQTIAGGGVIAFLTDTFYGIGCDPLDQAAVARVAALKGRDGNKPILVVVSDLAEVKRFVEQESELFRRLADAFWGGALTIVERARPGLPAPLVSSVGAIGLRLPGDVRVRNLIRACGGALTATSANPPGLPPATTAREAYDYFSGKLDLIVDAGAASEMLPSTVVDVSGGAARLVREGAVSRAALEQIARLAN